MNKISWLLSLLPPFLSLIVLRSYLGYFGNASLFSENLASAGIFSYVFIFIALTIIGMGLIFFLPSLIFTLFIPKKSEKIHNYSSIKVCMTVTLFLSLPLTLFIFFSWAFLSDRYPAYEQLTGWLFLLAGLLSVFFMNYLFLRKDVSNAQTYQKRKSQLLTAWLFYVGSPFLILSVIVLYSVFCLSIILGWVDTKAAGDSFLMVLKMAGLVSVLGIYLLLPGMIYVNTEAEKKNLQWQFRFVSATLILWFVLTGMYVHSFYPVFVDKSMALAGVSDWNTRRYEIDESKIPASHFSSSEWHIRSEVPGKYYSLQGIMVFSLNNVRLLCPESVKESYKNMLRFIPWDKEHDREMAKKLKDASARCQSFSQGDIVRLSEK
ncbi:hypothetical protein [Pantoea ananatis]|uniref:hypothetical protein n=1 Tax=Pantoea ananas TaxID=553 RepID=UPI0020CA3B38|nr:hypothetical protein [Pantoea ananatis]